MSSLSSINLMLYHNNSCGSIISDKRFTTDETSVQLGKPRILPSLPTLQIKNDFMFYQVEEDLFRCSVSDIKSLSHGYPDKGKVFPRSLDMRYFAFSNDGGYFLISTEKKLVQLSPSFSEENSYSLNELEKVLPSQINQVSVDAINNIFINTFNGFFIYTQKGAFLQYLEKFANISYHACSIRGNIFIYKERKNIFLKVLDNDYQTIIDSMKLPIAGDFRLHGMTVDKFDRIFVWGSASKANREVVNKLIFLQPDGQLIGEKEFPCASKIYNVFLNEDNDMLSVNLQIKDGERGKYRYRLEQFSLIDWNNSIFVNLKN